VGRVVNAETLDLLRRIEELLTRQQWLDTGIDPEAVLLREVRAALAKHTSQEAA
jgi:hypothetical protein